MMHLSHVMDVRPAGGVFVFALWSSWLGILHIGPRCPEIDMDMEKGLLDTYFYKQLAFHVHWRNCSEKPRPHKKDNKQTQRNKFPK